MTSSFTPSCHGCDSPQSTNALPGKGDSIPRILFGRCVREGKRMKMPVSVEVHHALVDGLDVARFFERFAANLDRA